MYILYLILKESCFSFLNICKAIAALTYNMLWSKSEFKFFYLLDFGSENYFLLNLSYKNIYCISKNKRKKNNMPTNTYSSMTLFYHLCLSVCPSVCSVHMHVLQSIDDNVPFPLHLSSININFSLTF